MVDVVDHRRVVASSFCTFVCMLLVFSCMACLFHPACGQWRLKGLPVSFADINSPYHEVSPLPHPSGTSLYFSRVRHPGNVSGEQDAGDLWYIKQSSPKTWGTPQPIIGAPNNLFENLPMGFSMGGKMLYYVYQTTQDPHQKQIAFSTWEGGRSWSAPTLCVIPYFKNFSTHLSAWVSNDRDTMILSLQSFHTHGHEDLYVSFKRDGAWCPLENMGGVINTPYQELTPFVSPDGMTLFFSSNKKGSEGGVDVYYSRRLDNSWKKWSLPINLGPAVNTKGSERYFRIAQDGEQAYYTSTTSSHEYSDVLKISLEKEDPATQNLLIDIPQLPAQRMLFISLWDAQTNERIGGKAYIYFLSPEKESTTQRVSSVFDAAFSFSGGLEKIVCQVPQYFYKTVSHENEVGVVWHYQIFMRKVVEQQSLSFQHVFFERGSTQIVSGGERELLDLAYTLAEEEDVHVFIEGHTDNRGNFNENLQLSQQRVQTIITYLIAQGIEARRLSGRGYGSARPIASNASEKGRRKNRRVSFILSRVNE